MAVAILQARMSSTRLPGKVMKSVAGRPMLERQIERLRRCSTLDRLIVATSDDASDDPLAQFLVQSDATGISLADVGSNFQFTIGTPNAYTTSPKSPSTAPPAPAPPATPALAGRCQRRR